MRRRAALPRVVREIHGVETGREVEQAARGGRLLASFDAPGAKVEGG
jgi:hypothetical protein